MAPSFAVGQAPWETAPTAAGGTPSAFPVGQAPWETAQTPSNPTSSGNGILDAVGNLSGIQGLASGLAGAIGAPFAQHTANQLNEEQQAMLQHSIQIRNQQHAAGKDTSTTDALIRGLLGSNAQASDILPQINTTPGQVLGSAAQTALTLGTAGLGGGKTLANPLEAAGGNVLQKTVAIPGGAAVAKAAGLTGLGDFAAKTAVNAGEGAALGYASDVATNATNNKDNIFTPGWGTFLGGAIPLATGLVGALGKATLAKTSGTGTEVLQRALDNPSAVNTAIKEYATTPEAQQSLVDQAKAAIGSYLHQRSTAYGETLASLPATDQIQTHVNVLDNFENKVAQFGGSIKDGALVFKDSPLTAGDQSNLQQAYKTINNWSDTSTKGMDTLRQAIGNLMQDFKLTGNTRANLILGQVEQGLKSDLSKVPGYSAMLQDYGAKSQTAKDLLKELSLGGNAKPSTQLTQIMKIFKKDPSVQQHLVEVMGQQKADQFLNEISGAILSHWFPPGVVGNAARAVLEGGAAIATGATAGLGTGALAGGAALASMSPRIVGKGAIVAGKAIQSGIGAVTRTAATIGASRLNQ